MLKDFTVIPNKHTPKNFHSAVQKLVRPHIPITEQQYDEIMRETAALDSDVLQHISGRLYTFGNADGGYALMQYLENYIEGK